MAVTHPDTIRNGLADYVVDAIDVAGPGTLEFQTVASAEVATLTFSATAFGNAGAVTPGLATANAITSDTSATGGTTTKAVFKSGTPADVVYCSVTGSGGGGDIELSSAVISAGQTVAVSALTYESAP
jgi:hypothetical protein